MLYGRRGVELILRHRAKRLKKLFVLKDAKFESSLQAEIDKLENVQVCSREQLDDLCSGVHQGIVAEVSTKELC